MNTRSPVPELSVVIVTWNCASLLRLCLRSLHQHAGSVLLEVIVVDNASSDDTLSVARSEWPGITVIANPDNRGFATASNQGMEAAHAPLLCLLNPDTELVQPGTLQRVVRWMAGRPQIDAVGVRLVFPDGRHQVGDAGHVPTLGSVFAHVSGFSRLSHRVRGVFVSGVTERTPAMRVGWVSGAFTVLRRELRSRVGGMDERYFLYGEDVEWGCRMNRAGCHVWYLPQVSIVHVQGGTQKRTHQAPSTRWVDGLSRLFYELHGGRGFTLYRVLLSTGLWARALGHGLARSPRAAALRHYAASAWRQDPARWISAGHG